MSAPRELGCLNCDDLMALIAGLQRQLAEAAATIEGLRRENTELMRSGKRQAAPSSKGMRATNPKRPGRKPGMGSPMQHRGRRLLSGLPSRRWTCP